MPVYCIKTADIPKEDLPLWYEAHSALEGEFPTIEWSEYIFGYEHVKLDIKYAPILIGVYTSPPEYKPLTLSILKKLAFLKLTGDCNDPYNTLSLLTSAED